MKTWIAKTWIEREDFDYKEHFDDRQKTLIPNPTLMNVKKISIFRKDLI